ncbi:sugar-binding transcriptional regulator [Agromyces sp. LHK192]|uniref:sugar-binding transcriptional regulator n=1 Tax=Agromyces sp. LHK192 TaxID=2498704 RepID=UPI001F0C0AF2|nr:sugar-binding transcriptional regulator [Agromyces sp. LHK192]
MIADDPTPVSRIPLERMSLLAKVARMYHEQGMRQPEIAERLHVSQSRVSRLLKEAQTLGVVRTVVIAPPGVYAELEDGVRDRYGLSDVIVASVDSDDELSLLNALGSAGAGYLETSLTGADRVGISSWSATLLATVDSMVPRTTRLATEIVQVIGGVGNPSAQVKATHLADRLARVTGGAPHYLPAPGVVSTRTARDALMSDMNIRGLQDSWEQLTIVLAGIGSLQPSPLLRDSGNALPDADLDDLRARSAVGDVCLRFFDADGVAIDSELDERVVGIPRDVLLAVPRRVGIAGGARKHEAIRAACRGGWINTLITDERTARALLED